MDLKNIKLADWVFVIVETIIIAFGLFTIIGSQLDKSEAKRRKFEEYKNYFESNGVKKEVENLIELNVEKKLPVLLKGKKCVNKHIIIERYIQLEILFLLPSPNKYSLYRRL